MIKNYLQLKPMIKQITLSLTLTSLLVSTPLLAKDNTQALQAVEAIPKSLPVEDVRTFVDIWDRIKKAYVEEVDDQTLLENAIRGMLSELDPHSSYLGPKDFEDLQINTTGEFGGLGIEVGMEDGFVKVVSPIDDTPAMKAGVLAGDLIISLDAKPVKGLSLNEAVAMMRGKPGSPIELTIVREGQAAPIKITVVRDVIQVKSVKRKDIEKDFGYIRISQFQMHTGKDLEKNLKKIMKNKDLKGLILDLRNNPGGVLQAAVDVSDLFIDEGLVVYTKGRMDSSKIEFEATDGDALNGLPMVVLVNSGSASASEIVAGALKDHQRAVIVGKKTFGKGSVQTVLPLAEDKALKLTTARYYTPSGTSIQAQGIVPDIEIELATLTKVDSFTEYRESDLAGHLSNENVDEKKDAQEKAEETLANKDYQLYEALNILKAMSFSYERQNKSRMKKSAASNELQTKKDPS